MSAPTKSIRFDAIVCMRAGEPATAYATAAVRPRPTNIHPYTARRYAVTRSATASAVTGETRVAGKSSMIVSCAIARSRAPADRNACVRPAGGTRYDRLVGHSRDDSCRPRTSLLGLAGEQEPWMQVVAFSNPSQPDWRWRIVNYAGEMVEES